MKTFNAIKLGIVLAGCAILPAASFAALDPHIGINLSVGSEVYPDTAPPAPIVEAEPPSPGSGYVWIDGGWVWEGHHWRWDKGRWQRPPHAGMHYVPHKYYEGHDGRHVYVNGGWK